MQNGPISSGFDEYLGQFSVDYIKFGSNHFGVWESKFVIHLLICSRAASINWQPVGTMKCFYFLENQFSEQKSISNEFVGLNFLIPSCGEVWNLAASLTPSETENYHEVHINSIEHANTQLGTDLSALKWVWCKIVFMAFLQLMDIWVSRKIDKLSHIHIKA